MIEIASADSKATEIAAIWWDDFFGTAEVLRFFAAVGDAVAADAISLPPPTLALIRESVARCFLLLEHSQVDGLWGGYLDTVALLGAYVSVAAREPVSEGSESAALRPEPRVVFRALRWMCDPTQRSSDGSVLHTAWLTTFFARTVVEVASLWPPAMTRLAELYDDLTLMMDRGISEHRSNYVAAMLERDRALEQLTETAEALAGARARAAYERWLRNRVILSASLVAFFVFALGGVGRALGVISIASKFKTGADALGVFSVWLTLLIGVITVVWTMGRPPDDR